MEAVNSRPRARAAHLRARPLDWPGVMAVFEGLSRPGRLAVFRSVLRAGEAGVDARALAKELHTTGSALTLHLRCLADAGLIRAREGGLGRFTADLGRLAEAVKLLESEQGSSGSGQD